MNRVETALVTAVVLLGLAIAGLWLYIALNTQQLQDPYLFCLDPSSGLPQCHFPTK